MHLLLLALRGGRAIFKSRKILPEKPVHITNYVLKQDIEGSHSLCALLPVQYTLYTVYMYWDSKLLVPIVYFSDPV